MYVLDQQSHQPLHVQLYEQLKSDISQNYKVGNKIPSVRKMASTYNLSKTTVESAYSQLVAEGYIESYPRSGYRVEETHVSSVTCKRKENTQEEVETPWRYDFYPARLSPDTFPLKLWKRLFNKYVDESLDFGVYSDGQGEVGLREEIAKYLSASRGVQCEASQVIIGNGFTDSMGVVAKILRKQGFHEVAVESPGYYMAPDVYSAYGYNIQKISVEKTGLNIKELQHSKAKLVYVTPSHQYPTGVTMPISKRHKLLAWAKAANGYIIEDDYDSELNYMNRPIPSLQGLDQEERVIYMGTFSKSLSAVLRVSYLVLPQALVALFQKELSSEYPSVPLMIQKVLEKFMSEGHWERHLRKIRTLNRKKHNLMKAKLIEQLGESMKIESEGGGLSLLINPTVPMNFEKLKALAKKERVKLYFAKDVGGTQWNALRMGFGGMSEKEIEGAIDLFASIWDEIV